MLPFQYFFTEIQTQTSSLILFRACQEKKILKDDRHIMSHRDFLFIEGLSVLKKRGKFFTDVGKMKKVSFI